MDREFFRSFFVLCDKSPSKLAHAVDKFGGKGHKTLVVKAGSPAGFFNASTGYFHARIRSNSYLAHRVVALLAGLDVTNEVEVDHRNGDTSDNSIGNLRIVTKSGNMRNLSRRSDNSSGHTGVTKMASSGREYYVARWYSERKLINRCFRIAGDGSEALALAVDARARGIKALNENGAGYTERHGN